MQSRYVCAAVIGPAEGHQRADTIAVVSDRRLCVAALAALLVSYTRRTVLRTAQGGEDVRDALETFRPAVSVAEFTRGEWPNTLQSTTKGRVLLLLDPEDETEFFVRAVRSRVHGYLSRTASREALEMAIEAVGSAGYYLDPLLTTRILWAAEENRQHPALAAPPELSQREREILVGIAIGRSSKEIAREYSVTTKTVCNHVSNIYAKLNLKHRGQLVLYAAQTRLTPYSA